MPLPRSLIVLPAVLALSGCMGEPPAPDYAFVGSWDCGVAKFAFTNTTYNDGTNTYAIKNVVRSGSNYTLFIEGGYRVGLGLVTENGLTWVSGTTGDQFNCRRV